MSVPWWAALRPAQSQISCGAGQHLLRWADGELIAADHPDAESARSRYRTLAASNTAALVELRPETGRMHQLRVHMAAIGRPIVGDARYGGALVLDGAPVKRPMLHAAAIAFPHPAGGRMRLEAEAPNDFKHLAAALRAGAQAA